MNSFLFLVDAKLIAEAPVNAGNAFGLTAIVSCDALNPMILSADFLVNASKELK